jgi:hypothetical protein
MGQVKKYNIRAALAEEALDAWVWSNVTVPENEDVPKKKYVMIRNPDKKKKIITYKRVIDPNFINRYNKKGRNKIISEEGKLYLVISECYRELLDIQPGEEIELEISPLNCIHNWRQIWLPHWIHPNPTMQCANRASWIAIIIGILSIIIGILSIVC